jgi:hypothetical protein
MEWVWLLKESIMAYDATIPTANEQKNVSQPKILENFAQIKTVFEVDHETFSAPNGQGKHKWSTYPVQAAAAPGAGELRVYANTSTFSGNPELFLRAAAGSPIEMTTAKKNQQGYTMLPSGLLIKWGNVTQASSSGGPFNFVWPAVGSDIPFSVQIWATVIPGSDPGDTTKDVNVATYVTDITNPLHVSYRSWRRNQFNTQGTNQAPFQVWVLAIGLP